jgi:AcrR family transcriptional regulator
LHVRATSAAHHPRPGRRPAPGTTFGGGVELSARDGYANASIEEICQTAYVGNKAFYDLFDSKEDCYVALLRQVSERIENQVAQAMQESADADEDELVRRLLSAFAHTLVDDPRVAMVTFGAAAGISPRVVATVGGLFETVTDFLHETDPPRPRTFDDLVSDLTTFMSVVEAGIRASGR